MYYLEETKHRRACGHPHLLSPQLYPGLLLFYLGSKMNYKHPCLIFGNAEKSCAVIEGSSIHEGKLSQWRKDEGIR